MSFKVDAGQLNRRITLLRATSAKNSVGENIETWNTLAVVWAQYTPASDGEKMNVNEQFASLEGRFIIRWSSLVANLNPLDQISFDGRTWNILGAKEIDRRRWIEVTAGTRTER